MRSAGSKGALAFRTGPPLSAVAMPRAFFANLSVRPTGDRERDPAVWCGAIALAFLALLVAHARLLNSNERLRRARRYYERGLSRLDGTWPGTGPDGARFLGEHLYTRDLDLFGRGSLFQLIDTARTEAGEETLADWLRVPAGAEEVLARQAAVASGSTSVKRSTSSRPRRTCRAPAC